jgi:hypothetical protein
MPEFPPGFEERVLQALENPKYKWHSLTGLATEVAADKETVGAFLEMRPQLAIKATDAKGKEWFTTKRHYQAKAGLWSKIVGGATGKVR